MNQCDNTLSHPAHRIAGTWREGCPGIDAEKIFFTQEIADLWWQAAGHDNGAISGSGTAFYGALETALIGAIADTYPDVNPDTVQDILIDCGESVWDCVQHWRTENERHTWCEKDVEQLDDGKYYCHLHSVTWISPYYVDKVLLIESPHDHLTG